MLTIIYCAKDKRKQAKELIDVEAPYLFASPLNAKVDHSATRVIVVGNHPSIVEQYKGLAKVEHIELDESENED